MSALSYNEIRARLARFAEKWADAADEDAEAKSFWDDIFTCYGTNRRQVARFEVPVGKLDGNKGFIDLLWKGKLIAEHKSRGRDLAAAKGQAEDYMARLKPAERPRFLVTCDFARFEVFDLHNGNEEKFALHELAAKAEVLGFLGGYEPKRPSDEAPVNIEAVERLGQLYDAMKAGGYPDHDLQSFLVRVLFCLFAEDTGVFEPEAFTGIIVDRTAEDRSDLGIKLAQVFETLDSEKSRRQRALDEVIAGLPYVNGSLFAGRLALAATDSKMRAALIACTEFDWSKISPAIFGSLFQGVMEPAERRAAGAHYTGEDNILKVIRPLFLDALRAEFAAIKAGPERGRSQKLEAFHDKLASLRFLDPACGCGNFLIVTHRELRRLEIALLKELHPVGQQVLDVAMLTKVSVAQCHGIEMDEFPAQIARVALWLMDHVMNVELGHTFGTAVLRLPLTQSAHITHGNALRVDWREIIPSAECSYVFGNPPFVGKKARTSEQQKDMDALWGKTKGTGVLDFVTCWFRLAAAYIQGTRISVAFVSTNSVSQGEQVNILWESLFADYGVKIQFAYRTFAWESEARGKANVHVVIVGFGLEEAPLKQIFDSSRDVRNPAMAVANNISPYLIEGNHATLDNRSTPISAVPEAKFGSMPNDGGHLLFTDAEKSAFLSAEPQSLPLFRAFLSAHEYLHGENRWCLWLQNVEPAVLRGCPKVMDRIKAVREYREASTREATRRLASTPGLFGEIRAPHSRFVLIPCHSSETRIYIPFSYFEPVYIPNNSCLFLEDASLYHFGVLSSAMHMSWMRQICGRLESRFRYSNKLVYNNFPWPAAGAQRSAGAMPAGRQVPPASSIPVETCAQAVIDARAQFPASTLADLYDPLCMPPALARAHAALDRAVERCYRPEPFASDRERVEFLFALYEELAAPQKQKPTSACPR